MSERLEPFEASREALAERLGLRRQWEDQVRALNELGILEILPDTQEIGIVGIDGKEYPIPKYQEILSQITPENLEMLETKSEQGFTQLLMVPLGMPLEILIDRYQRELLKKNQEGKLRSTDGTPLELDTNQPIYVWDQIRGADVDGRMSYYPTQFSQEGHNGQTKQELIDQGEAWEVVLMEDLPDLPEEGKGETIGGRKQLEAAQSPNQYLETIQHDPSYQDERGLTLEAWLTYATTHLHTTDTQIDDWQGKGKATRLLASYLPASSNILHSYWSRGDHQAILYRYDPGNRGSDCGSRSSVKIKKS